MQGRERLGWCIILKRENLSLITRAELLSLSILSCNNTCTLIAELYIWLNVKVFNISDSLKKVSI